jgi:hypothetical protein
MLNDLESSNDCRSVSGHGNQRVCLRGAQIIKASLPSARIIAEHVMLRGAPQIDLWLNEPKPQTKIHLSTPKK